MSALGRLLRKHGYYPMLPCSSSPVQVLDLVVNDSGPSKPPTTHPSSVKRHRQIHHPDPKSIHSRYRPHSIGRDRHRMPHWPQSRACAHAHSVRYHHPRADRTRCSMGSGSCRRRGCSHIASNRVSTRRTVALPMVDPQMLADLR